MKNKLRLVSSIVVVMSVVLIPFLIWADGEGPRERPKGPPQEMIAACEDKSVGDACEFVNPQGDTVSGTCQNSPRDEGQLVCMPNERPERPEGPPPEMSAACEDKSVGDACEFVSPRGDTVSGTCQNSPRDEGQLVCVPNERPERPERPEN
jgi:hypothetical protein